MTHEHDHGTGRPSLRGLLTDRLGRWSIRSLQIIAILILASGAVFALVQLRLVVIPLLIATILACAAAPLVGWLRRGVGAMGAAWITLLGGIVVIGGLVTLVVFAVRGQWGDLQESAVQGFQKVQAWALSLDLPFDLDLESIDVEQIQADAVGFLTSSSFGSGAVAGLSAAGEFVTGLVLTITILFFFLKDGDRIWAFFLRPFRGARRARGERVGRTGIRVLGGYVRGTATIAAVDALGIGIGLAILQVPLALPLSVIVFVGAFVPIVGATVAGILAAVVALVANGWLAAVIVVGVVVLVNQLEGNFLQPVVMGQSLKIHPLVILVALTGGTILGGITGAVLAVPIVAFGWAVVKDWDRDALPSAPPRTPRWRVALVRR
ncbi:AI-2E family transporter [Homoserinibacter sp. YIM 151385]|uniref:AI-2E family transporter n=1 Tax=Homoserinibacter sp. YIM 151385 TaxID=2985506 RepID=UPI0022F023C3|nr:AI-2E family transporter [Homoserinibacter sp. YIM 151385]WBU39111.1 AI-2E family transporter [Homoserinibacter sp. YIM 151385]